MPEKMQNEKNQTQKGTLYLVGTPIGNLADMSERARKVLSEADFIAAEDTRNAMKLLSLFGIQKKLVSYFEHNQKERGEQILQRLRAGETCALITDAGMPAISDPGEGLVRLCVENDIPVTTVPGPNAALTALTLSALSTARFVFEGFLPPPSNKSERRKRLEALKREERTVLLHEAPHKLKNTLADLCDTLGKDRHIALCRELTKLNEQVLHLTLGEACAYFSEHEPRGEFVLVVEGAPAIVEDAFWKSLSVPDHVRHYMAQGLAKNDAIKAAAKDRGVPKNEIYQEALSL